MTYHLVIVVRVSGGHLCKAEAPTEPAGETTVRCAAIRPLSLRSRVNGCGNPFFPLLVIAVWVSGGHLCKAEAPTEPAGETAARCVAIRFSPSSSFRGALAPWQSVFPFKGITDSFALCAQNDIPFCHCGAGVRRTPLRSRSTYRAGRRDHRKVRGNPFPLPYIIAKPTTASIILQKE